MRHKAGALVFEFWGLRGPFILLLMYAQYFGLKHEPFSIAPDPAFLYMSPQHEQVLSVLKYALVSRSGFCVITGDVGAGKTIACSRAMPGGTMASIKACLDATPITDSMRRSSVASMPSGSSLRAQPASPKSSVT